MKSLSTYISSVSSSFPLYRHEADVELIVLLIRQVDVATILAADCDGCCCDEKQYAEDDGYSHHLSVL